MTDRTKTEIVTVLDRSGSMSTMKADMDQVCRRSV